MAKKPTADMTPTDDRPAAPDPDLDADHGVTVGPLEDPDAGAYVEPLTVDEVEVLLTGAGRGLHSLFGDPRIDEHWAFTPDEVAALAPPLTSIANRRPTMLRIVRQSDAANAALVMAAYVRRNVRLGAEIADTDAAAADAPRVPPPEPADPDPSSWPSDDRRLDATPAD